MYVNWQTARFGVARLSVRVRSLQFRAYAHIFNKGDDAMKIKPCQINARYPCADRGRACLKTKEEKEKFNRQVSKMQEDLEKMKFDLSEDKP